MIDVSFFRYVLRTRKSIRKTHRFCERTFIRATNSLKRTYLLLLKIRISYSIPYFFPFVNGSEEIFPKRM